MFVFAQWKGSKSTPHSRTMSIPTKCMCDENVRSDMILRVALGSGGDADLERNLRERARTLTQEHGEETMEAIEMDI